MPVKKINLEGDQVTFQIVLEFGEQKFEINFAGKLDGQKLTGEFTSERGTQKATGKKIVPPSKEESQIIIISADHQLQPARI